MHLSDFDYDLPADRIARSPASPRDAARMMVLNAQTGATLDTSFNKLAGFLQPSDILVLNDTRVVRARTHARLERAGGTARDIEIFFAEPIRDGLWRVLCKPGRRIREGDRAIFGGGELTGTFRRSEDADLHVLELDLKAGMTVEDALARFGAIPLPPYLERPAEDADETDYQTVYASQPGAIAAPTAGLHFTDRVFQAIRERGVEVVRITLHVGVGTFLPVRTERPENHILRPERFEVSVESAARIEAARRNGQRIVAAGTTTTRTLEYLMLKHGEIRAGAGAADLYILPGFQFRIVRALLTNFHLPRSTLLMLVSAFAGRARILTAYQRAIAEGYRFYSYGDCMLIES